MRLILAFLMFFSATAYAGISGEMIKKTVTAGGEQVPAIVFRYKIDGGDLKCSFVSMRYFDLVNDSSWEHFEAKPITWTTETYPCNDLKWVVAKNRHYTTRPAYELTDFELKNTGLRIAVNHPCTQPVFRDSTGGRKYMQVMPGIYAVCEVMK